MLMDEADEADVEMIKKRAQMLGDVADDADIGWEQNWSKWKWWAIKKSALYFFKYRRFNMFICQRRFLLASSAISANICDRD